MNIRISIIILLAALTGLFALSKPVVAVVPEIEILNPTTDSVHIQNTSVLFEVAIRGGAENHDFQIQWDFNPETEYDVTTGQVNDVESFPVYFPQNPAANAALRLNLQLQPPFFSTPGQRYTARVLVTDLDDPTQTASASTSLFLLAPGPDEGIVFTGYTWSGAASGTCSGGSNPGTFCIEGNECLGGGTCIPQSDALGWTSFSCTNFNTQCTNNPTYNVRYSKAPTVPYGTLRNSAWVGEESPTGAKSIGWLTWSKGICINGSNPGSSCTQNPDCAGGGSCDLTGDPPTGGPVDEPEAWSAYEEINHIYSSYESGLGRYPSQTSGWGRFLTMRNYARDDLGLGANNDWGWVRLRGNPVADPTNINPPTKAFHQCSDCSAGNFKCNICDRVQVNEGEPEAQWQRYSCNSCYQCDASGNCTSCEACSEYGVSYNTQLSTLTGYAWANKASESGFGWIQFDPIFGGIGLLQSWLATRYGDIFVSTSNNEGKSIIVTTPLPHPPGNNNATYLIQANGTIEFTSTFGYLQPGYPSEILLPSAGNQYINVLGRLDFAGMTRVGENRYGTTEIVTEAQVNSWADTKVLDGNIYWVQGDLSIDTAIEFQPGSGDQSGAGTIIVEGDLTINQPITYDSSAIGKLINLPSVAWLVRGDVHIDPNLGTLPDDNDPTPDPNIVGAFIVVGCPGGSEMCGPQPKDGIVRTGVSATHELIVHGLMMAKEFVFERTVPTPRGSEQVIYEGKIIANPPPGLHDLSASLPIIREVTP